MLGRRIRSRIPAVQNQREMRVALIEEWDGLLQGQIDGLILTLAISHHNSDVLPNLAKVQLHLQYLDDAMYLTRKSLEVGPSERDAWQQYFILGEIFKAYGYYQEAEVHFRHTLDL
ncbi:hypothetical protein ABEB36_014957 [Hypothenemus hampei]|uniref:Tetratricopeptide repeat protein n=1 Tax=Hypothenemus hampei TaxID=57062 RepID=A0ABD1E1N8_HYPHA